VLFRCHVIQLCYSHWSSADCLHSYVAYTHPNSTLLVGASAAAADRTHANVVRRWFDTARANGTAADQRDVLASAPRLNIIAAATTAAAVVAKTKLLQLMRTRRDAACRSMRCRLVKWHDRRLSFARSSLDVVWRRCDDVGEDAVRSGEEERRERMKEEMLNEWQQRSNSMLRCLHYVDVHKSNVFFFAARTLQTITTSLV